MSILPARRRVARILVLSAVLVILAVSPASARQCPNGRSGDAAMWLSILHPGVGEWFLNGWGSFGQNVPKHKFWFGFIPFYGWPGYLQVRSAIDASNCKTDDI